MKKNISFITIVVLLIIFTMLLSLAYQYSDLAGPISTSRGTSGNDDQCDPEKAAQICCRVVNSKDQCNNRCNIRAQNCGWTTKDRDKCTAKVNQDCTRV